MCKNIDFIVINSDERILKEAKTSNKYLLSEGNYSNENESTGCGGNPKIGKQNERFWHENALFLEKKVRKSAFSCHFKEKYRNFAVEPKH